MPTLTTVAQGSLRPSIYVTWTHADNTTPEDLTNAALSGWIKDLATGDVRAIAGDLVVTDGTAGIFRWDFDPNDVTDAGSFEVQFSAVFTGDPTPGRSIIANWEIAESIIDPLSPGELADYQGVVRLLVRTTDPDAANTGYIGLWAKADGLYLTDDGGVTQGPFSDGSAAATEAIAAHEAALDPHAQYLTETEADALYSAIGHTHDYSAVYAPISHTHAVTDVTDLGEYVQDTAAAMITGATHTNISVAYDDTAGTLAITASAGYTDEQAQDAAASLFTTATHDGVSTVYTDAAATLAITNTDKGSSAVSTHEGASDPHPDYLKQAEADLLYAPVSLTQYTDEQAQDAAASLFTTATHSGVSVAYNDAAGTLAITNSVTQYTNEMAQDAAASMLTSATHSGASVAYDDTGNTLAITVADQGGILKSLLDAKGDIIAASADNTPAKVTVGTNDYILIADSAQTAGIKWGVNAPTWTNVSGKPSIYQSTLFLNNTASGVSTYKTALTNPTSATETTATAVANSGAGEVLIAGFITPQMGVTVINGNAWSFKTFAKVDSATGVSNIVLRVYKRATDGTETQLFTDQTAEINTTVVTEFDIDSVQGSFTCAATDRMVLKYFAKTTSGGNRTFTLYYQGTENYSHVSTPVLFASLTLATDTLWDSKGDLAVGSGSDAAAILPVSGTNGYVLTEDSAQTLGVKWAALPTMFTTEDAQDATAAALAAGTHTGITVSYNDAGNALSLTNTITQYTNEMAQDAVAAALAAGTHTNVTVTYDDTANSISLEASGVGGGSVATDAIFDAKGDLAVGTGANTAAKLTAGTNDFVLTAASGEATGLKWAAIPDQGGIAETLIDAKGDLIVGSAADTAARLAVGGTNGHVLTVNSGATNGIEWAAVSASGDVSTDAIWDTKGDIAVATAGNTAQKLPVGANGLVLTAASGETTGVKWQAPTRYITLGRYGTLTATAGTDRLYVPYACTIVNVYASVSTAPTGADLVADIHKGGTTIFTTQGNRPTIAASAFTDTSSTPDVTAISANDYLTLDVDVIGSTVAGADLRVILEVTVP